MKELAPPAVAFTARLGAPRHDDRAAHGAVVRAVARGHVRVAPVDVEDLGEGISVRLTTGAVQPSEDGRVGAEFSHGTLRRGGLPLGGSDRAHPEVRPVAFAIC